MAISSSKDFIVFPNDNSGRVFINEASFTASGTWTAPAGVTSAQVILVGGGGGGGGGSRDVAGGGGGGGQVIVKNLTVTPLTTYQVSIGAGGQGGLGAQNSTADIVSTLPGGNGTPTTFGTVSVFNLLTNTDFDYGINGWDPAVIFRQGTGISGQSSITVYPNANGLAAGMFVAGTNVGTSAQIVSISGNIITVSVANAGTIQAPLRFDTAQNVVRPANQFFYNVSSGEITNNTQTVGVATSPFFQNLSNNIMQPEVAQLEEAAILTNNYIRQFGTALSSFSITNAGVPTKLAEMVGGYAKVAQLTLTSTSVTVDSTLNIFPGMFLVGTGIASGTTVLSVDSLTTLTMSAGATQTRASEPITVSYTGAFGINGLIAGTSSSTSAGAPTWVSFSNLNSTTTSNGTQTATNFGGVPYIPGQSYTFSAYISTNVNISTSTPILFQIRSSGASWNAISSTSYLGGSNSGTTNSIDAGQANGFFVRQTTPATLTNYGGTFGTTATGSNGATTITVADATGILIGMAVTGSGIQSNTVVSSVAGTSIGLSLATNAPLSATSLSFANPSGVQMLGSNVTVGQTGWRRLSATFSTPAIASALANGQYAWGSTPQFIHPTIVFQQPSVNYWIDNVQLEVGGTTTTWRPPVYREAQTAMMMSTASTTGNLETSHRFVKATAGTVYSGSMFVIGGGTSQQYRPVRAFLEFFDRDYNSLSRFEGNNTYIGFNGVSTLTQQMPNVTYPVRVGITNQAAPVNTAFVKLGLMNFQGAQSATANAIEYHIIAPQLEIGSTATVYKEVDNVNYFFAGEAGATPIVSSALVTAEGGGGGGTYNSNMTTWQWGIEGGNNGGHAGYGSNSYMTLAGGGAGAGGPGYNAISYTPSFSTSPNGGFGSTLGNTHNVFPARGFHGGASQVNSGTGNTNIPGFAGDGGEGQFINGLNSGSPLGLPLGGGGGGAGWTTISTSQLTPGRGKAGGGKGGGNFIYNQSTASGDYYARGLDAIQNTGGGGGGGSSNNGNDPLGLIAHSAAQAAVNYEAISSDYFKWSPVYNATLALSTQGGFYGSNVLRATIQDTGNAKLVTDWQSFPILPRIPLYFPGVAARLTTAPGGVTSSQFPGLAKRVRPTVRWKDQNNTLIREDRPPYDIIFAGTNTITFLGAVGATSGSWQTLVAPTNAAFFDVTWELLYMDAGDIVDVDFGGCQYYGYWSFGGNGADGYALVRWFDKAVL